LWVSPDNINSKGLMYSYLTKAVLQEILTEKEIEYKNGKYIYKDMCELSPNLTFKEDEYDRNCYLLFSFFKLAKLTEDELIVLTLLFDLDTPQEYFSQYEKIDERDRGKWTIGEIARGICKTETEVKNLKIRAIKKLKKVSK